MALFCLDAEIILMFLPGATIKKIHNTVKHQTLPHPKFDEVIVKSKKTKQNKKHIVRRVKANTSSTALELRSSKNRPEGINREEVLFRDSKD